MEELTTNTEWPNADTNRTLSGRIIRLSITCIRDRANGLLLFTRCILLKAKGPVTYYAPVSSSTSSRYQVVKGSSSSPWSPLSLLTSSSPPLQPPPSWSSSLSSSSSPTMSSVSLPLSPSPSLVGNSSTALPELTSSFLSSTQSQTTSLAAFTRGQTLPTSRTKLQSLWPFISDGTANKIASTGIRHPSTSLLVIPIEPSKTTSTTTVSSSSAGGGGSPGKRGTRTSENDNGVVIGAAVGGAVVLGIIAIIIIVFWKRRKAGKSTEKQTKQVKSPVYGTSNEDIQLERPNGDQTISSHAQDDQSMYQGLIIANGHSNGRAVYSSPEDEYDNCTVYQSLEKPRSGTPVYQSLKAGQTEPAHTTGIPNLKPIARYTTLPNATGTPIAKGNGATGIANLKGKTATGVPKSKPGTKGQPSQRLNSTLEPVYNILDGPGSDQGTTPEPPYNVLEGPDTGQDYEATNVDPLYNVLEGPNTTYDSAEIVLENNGAQNGPISGQSPDNNPLYNVLEGPESDQKSLGTGQDPLYNVLEGPDAEKSSLVDHGGPIDEPLYNVLEGPDFCGSNQHAPNKPRPLSGHDNLAYEQTLEMHVPNAALRRPGTQRESVYEALRGRTQDLYEALGQSGDPHSTC